MTQDSNTSKEFRRAALNLMEDAVEARRSEQKENVERRRVEDELRKANQLKDEFLSTLAHELRNPLAPIRNGLTILRNGASSSTAREQVLLMMNRQVEQMVRLVDDLMEVSRITRGKIELRTEAVDLFSIVRSAIETCTPQIEAAHHTLFVNLPPENLWINADRFESFSYWQI